jgi:hypothetical protein
MTTCNRCGKAVSNVEWDIHTCTAKPGLCNDCETVAHCLKHGCVPKHQALEQMAQNARELGLDYESSESNKAAYQRGYLDGMAKPCVECADRKWVGLTDEERQACINYRAVEAKLKELNT